MKQNSGRYRFNREGILRVGEILRGARETKCWSLQELQNYCGLPPSTSSDIENGCVTKIHADTLETLRVALEPQNPHTGRTYTLGELYELMLVKEEILNGVKGKR
ncbi:helix-turn-helix domain-containing protein [Aerosakkonema funiforme]|uniref:Helix-turn-helix transcriptional regulator n=1 Tax=Aerosakkonema funiforme FACHB-1375 TaxID=2949571 RepID=A0A926VI63_9CYAN|nr:helix-turn-helix transcriptional regulator [Aerosakkonema funiforme]MBD2183588.1 helix-turn-helix transcriptional regulator [Aerosakkonema funiforme FACHB-1375]